MPHVRCEIDVHARREVPLCVVTCINRRIGVVRSRLGSWKCEGSHAGAYGGSSGRGSSRSAARGWSAWPVACMSIHKRLTVPVYMSNAIRKKDTPACGRVVFWYKRLSFLWVVAATRYAFTLSLVRQDGREERPHDLRTCLSRRGEKEKSRIWAFGSAFSEKFARQWGSAPAGYARNLYRSSLSS